MAIARVEYGGYEIWVYDVFKAMKVKIVSNGVEVKSDLESIEDATIWIDKHNKKTFKRIPIIELEEKGTSWHDDLSKATWTIKHGEATSIIGDNEVWTVFSGSRSKSTIDKVIIDTEANRNAMEAIIAMKKRSLEINAEAVKIRKSMERLKPEMMDEK